MRILRIWGQTLVPPAITMTLYFLIFGEPDRLAHRRHGRLRLHGLHRARPGDDGGDPERLRQHQSSSFFGAKFGRHVEELLVSPMPNWVILGGYVAGGVLRGLMVGAIVLVIAMLFTQVRMPHPLVTITTVLLGATIFSLAGFVNAVYAKKFDDIAIVPTFILTPLTYLGGVFYSVRVLPDWARGGHPRQSDLLHGQRVPLRPARREGTDVSIWLSYAVMLGFIVALGWLGMWLLKRGIGLRS